MSEINTERWLDAAFENFQQAVDEGNYALCKDIIADVQDVNLEAGRQLNEVLRATPIEKFAVRSHIQPHDL